MCTFREANMASLVCPNMGKHASSVWFRRRQAGKFLPFLISIITARATRMSMPIRNSPSTGERKIEGKSKGREREREEYKSPLGRSNNAREISGMPDLSRRCIVVTWRERQRGHLAPALSCLTRVALRTRMRSCKWKIPYEPSPSLPRSFQLWRGELWNGKRRILILIDSDLSEKIMFSDNSFSESKLPIEL